MRAVVPALALLALAACGPKPPPAPPPPGPAEPRTGAVTLSEPQPRSAFGLPDSALGTVPPAAVPQVRPEAGLANLADRERFAFLTDRQRSLLTSQGFVAVPSDDLQLDDVYRRNHNEGVAGFVTADTMLYAFTRLTEDTRRRFADGLGAERLKSLTLALVDRCQAQLQQVTGPEAKAAVQANLAYFAVAASLQGLQVDIDPTAAEQAKAELLQIAADAQPERSVLFPYEIDYAAFATPAAQADTPRLTQFRRALLWYRVAPLATETVDADGRAQPAWDVVRRIALLLDAVAAPPDRVLRDLEALHDCLRFFDGDGPGLDVDTALEVAEEVFGPSRTPKVYDDIDLLRAFAGALAQRCPAPLQPLPRYNGGPGLTRVRLFSQPEPPDRIVLAALDDAAGLDLFGLLGQPRAAALVDRVYRRAARDPSYAAAHDALQGRLHQLDSESWQSDLPRGLLWAAAPLSSAVASGAPWFQQSAAWADKELLTSLANWAAARHRLPGSAPGDPELWLHREEPNPGPPVYVEPVPELYDRLDRLSRAVTVGLQAHALLDESSAQAHEAFRDLAGALARVAVQELRNAVPSANDRLALATFDADLGWLLHGLDTSLSREEQGLPRVAAVGERRDGRQLAVAVGPVQVVYVAVPDGEGLRLTRGAMLSYHEVLAPADAPLTDAAWAHDLRAGTAAGQPEWAASFITTNPRRPNLARPVAKPVGAR